MQKIKLTEEAKKVLQEKILEKEQELRQLGKYKASASENEGDTWHDNFAFEQAEIQERALIKEIADMRLQVNTAEIIDANEINDDESAKIDSVIRVLMKYAEDDEEECEFVLTGGVKKGIEIPSVSINAPLGKCVYGKKIGFEGNYSVKDNKIHVKILSITN